ncbi:hypothetical protein [Psychroserpens algicola]|uniref:Uncharacterized protein n=2 Tax=Psychroserpens algicola TaxID=1719034 RepID=A0ABT0H8F2_9FLAO|nr:hypothetical protein [Psychroserpens algicola]MCK8480651.1 hypothetical protein [Psychroserpens algicola]
MTEAEKNEEKRKHMSLTNSEFLTFFFFPYNVKRFGMNDYELNKSEDERFVKYGFETKLKEADSARLYGTIFYIGIAIILGVIFK